jgi:hypothetical protein
VNSANKNNFNITMILTDAQYQERLNTIKGIRLAIPVDPFAAGLQALSSKLSEIQSQRDLISSMLVEAIQNRANARITFESNKAELDMQIDALLANDNEVKGQKTAELRSATASTKCAGLELKKHQAEVESIRADSYCSIVQQVYSAISSADDSLSKQIEILRLGFDIGYFKPENLGKK